MPVTDGFKQEVEDVLMDILKDALGGAFKEYYVGDIQYYPRRSLPCLVIEEEGSEHELGYTGTDEVTTDLVIMAIFDLKEEFGKKSSDANLFRRIRNITKGRDATTGAYKANSLMGALRRNYSGNDRFTLNINSTDTPTLNERSVGGDLITKEFHVRVTVKEYVPVPNRDS